MLKQFKTLAATLAVVLSLTAVAFGQGRSGDVDGTVSDATGAVVPGATVTMVSTGSTAGFKRTVTTNENGYFIFSSVSPGSYRVTIEADSFAKFERNVNVIIDKTVSVNPQLKAQGSENVVDVDTTDSAVTIDLGNTKIDTNITKDVFEALPKAVNATSVLKVAPNVRPETAAGGLQIDGASGSENVFVIDGQEVTNFASGTLNVNNNLPFELLQEVQVKSTGFEAEYGGATGGVINLATPGGNNDWRGTFAVSFEPALFQGAPNRGLNTYGSGPGEFEYFTPLKTRGTNFFPVGALSGPIIKDKVWGTINYAPQIFEGTRDVRYFDSPAPTRNQTTTARFENTTRSEYAFTRIDAQPISSLRVFGSFLYNPVAIDGQLPSSFEGLNNSQPPISPEDYAQRGGRVNSNSWNTQATWTPLSWLVLNFRTGRSFLNEKGGAYGLVAGTRFAVSTGSPLNPCTDIAIPGGTDFCRGFNTGPNSLTNFDVSTRQTYDVDASFVGVNAGGRHNIKVGYQRNELYNNVDSGYTSTGYVLLYYGLNLTAWTGLPSLPDCDFQNITPGDTTCTLGSARIARIGTAGEASSDNVALFAQDSWQVTDRLTLNLGVRVENEIVPSFGDPATTTDIEFSWGDKVAPRLGFAFDLTGDGKTKLFGSYGWFYDRFKYELPRGLFGAETFVDAFAQITPARGFTPFDYTQQVLLGGRGIINGGECPITGGPTGIAECEFDRRVPSNAIDANPFAGAGAVDPDLKAMRQSEFTFGLERELGNNFVLGARFTHKQLDRAIEDIGAFNDQGSEAYVIGNPGQGLACEISMQSNLPCTEAERKYDAVEVRLDKRTSKYFFNANYTWSRLFGNYSGLASSDEFGRNSPNVNRFFDLPMLGWNANGEPDNGLLGTDRTHVFKSYGGYTYDWNGNGVHTTTFTGYTSVQSGTPITTFYDLYNVTTSILFGRGDLGRTDAFTETDLGIRHKYRFGRDNRFTIEPFVEILNLFDERNEIRRFSAISSSNITAPNLQAVGCTTCVDEVGVFDTIFNQGGIQQFVLAHFAANPNLENNDYNQSTSFQTPRNVRFGFRFRF